MMVSTIQKPEEHCELQPQRHCRLITKLVPHLTTKEVSFKSYFFCIFLTIFNYFPGVQHGAKGDLYVEVDQPAPGEKADSAEVVHQEEAGGAEHDATINKFKPDQNLSKL